MADKSKVEFDCCRWIKVLAGVTLIGVPLSLAAGIAGIFTDIGKDGSILPTPAVTIIVGVPTLNGYWVTFTPTPTATPVPQVRPQEPVPPARVEYPIFVPNPPVVVVVTVVAVEPTRAGVSVVPAATPAPAPTPCWPQPSRGCR